MTGVGVHRWQTEFVTAAPLPAEQIGFWNAGLRALDLGAVDLSLDDDEWVFIRRLALTSRWAADADAFAALRACQESLAAGVRNALRDSSANAVVRYRDQRDALIDMLYRAATGDLRRAFAWRRMGLLPTSGGEVAVRDVAERAVIALAGRPDYIWPALARFIQAESAIGAWTTLMHSLDAAHWDKLLRACPQTRGLQQEAERTPPRAHGSPTANVTSPLAQSLCEWMSAHPWTARERRVQLAVLLACAHDWQITADGDGADCQSRLSEAAAVVARHVGPALERFPVRRRDRYEGPAPSMRNAVNPTVGAREDAAEPPPLPVDETRVATAWAGLAFLLNVVPRCALLDRVDAATNVGSEHCLQWVLRRIAIVHFGVPADDPTVRAWCGGWLPREDADAWPDAIDALATEGAAMLREALHACVPQLAETSDPVQAVCKRPGHVFFAPGWIEIHMDSRQADVRLRRAALDFDPGFVPWLGCVVRFRYA